MISERPKKYTLGRHRSHRMSPLSQASVNHAKVDKISCQSTPSFLQETGFYIAQALACRRTHLFGFARILERAKTARQPFQQLT